jgi:cytochrome b561
LILVNVRGRGHETIANKTGCTTMQWLNSQDRYGAISQATHWLTVALVLLAWFLGQFGDAFPRGPSRDMALFVHISAGLAILALLIVRLAWRLASAPPTAEPTPCGHWAGRASALAHAVLYLLLAAVPIVGIVVQFARGNPLPIFGLFEIASPWPADRALSRSIREIHEFAANALLIVAGLHAVAALGHHWILRDRTLQRMLPGA